MVSDRNSRAFGGLVGGVGSVLLWMAALSVGIASAEPGLNGQTGLIYMPDARIDPDGTLRSGYSYTDPYRAYWLSLTALPRLEASFRYTEIDGVPAFVGVPGADYGDYKDKAFDVKFLLTEEGRWWPALGVGAQDIGQGTGVFRANYVTMGKRLGDFDFTLGFGNQRIDGAFGGVRYSPEWLPHWSLVAEYDANDYSRDHGASITGVNNRDKDVVAGIEYRSGWIGLQASYGHDTVGLNAYVAMPLEQEEWVPNVNEPEPYTALPPRPNSAQWRDDSQHERTMVSALLAQDFKDVRVRYAYERLDVVLTNTRISDMSRAVGRAARTVVRLAPIETREIRIVYTIADMPFTTYTFTDVKRLQAYFNGMIGREELRESVVIEPSEPGEDELESAREDVLAAMEDESRITAGFMDPQEGDIYSFRSESGSLDRFKIGPKISLYLNDPAGAFKYDLYILALYDRKLAERTFFSGAVRATVAESVSDVTQPSNSELPHVRSDIAEYYRENGLKIDRMLLNRFFHPAERVYARASAGIYELMYSGVGGQVLYLPESGRWGTDLSVDWLRQRDYRGFFDHLDYETVTALGAVHYRMPYYGLTTTLRAGRFLAKDNGARIEIKRRFKSGIELGAWYTFTDGDDITSPGTPDDPYYDKGIFAMIPLDVMLTRDTQASARMSLEPWTRDVGQMVRSPADLYELLAEPVRNRSSQDGLVRFGDLVDDPYTPPPPSAVREAANWDAFKYYITQGSDSVFSGRTVLFGLGAVAAVGLAYTQDDEVDDWARDHRDDRLNRVLADAGRITTLSMLGASALATLDRDDIRLSRTAVTSLQSAALGLAASYGLKYAVDRSRPDAELGKKDFNSGEGGDSSFPSDLTTVAWATVTPYAKEYDAPWLYGVASLANLGRIAERRHWLSDTVAGSLLGWGIGSLMWELNRDRKKEGLVEVAITPRSVRATWAY